MNDKLEQYLEKLKQERPEMSFYLDTYGLKGSSAGYLITSMSKEELINENKLINQKQSNLSKKERDTVLSRISYMIGKGELTQQELN